MQFDFTSLNLLTVVVMVVGITSGWLIIQLANWLRSKSVQWKQANKFDKLDKYIDIAVNTVIDTIQALNQSVVNDLKEAAADGKLTEDEKEEILTNAIETVMATLSDEIKVVLGTIYGDLPTWIKTQIDKYVAVEKENTGVSSSSFKYVREDEFVEGEA